MLHMRDLQGEMAPGKRRETKENKSGSLRSKAGNKKANRTSHIKKAKGKSVPKKKLKAQTSRQIEDVNDTFADLRNQLVHENASSADGRDKIQETSVCTTVADEMPGKETPKTEKKQETTREVTQEEVLETAEYIASL